MAIAAQGSLNLEECPSSGSRTVNSFKRVRLIGEGTYGQVYEAQDIITGERAALKKIKLDNWKEGFPLPIIHEIKLLKNMDHENVIKLKEIVTSPGPQIDEQGRSDGNKYKGNIYMVFEYMDHDLSVVLNCSTVPQIKIYMRQLLKGLHYCHANNVLHRDIKGPNLLINRRGILKLADFGLARSFIKGGNFTNRVITLWYRPPELLLGATKYDEAVDMWSVGCIFAEFLSRRPIFPGKSEHEQLYKIFELCGTPDEETWPDVSRLPWYNTCKPTMPMKRRLREVFPHVVHHALQLLERMLTLNPSQRISARDALDAPYFRY